MTIGDVTFIAKVQKIHRVAIPRTISELMGIDEGDYVKLKVIEKMSKEESVKMRT